MLNLLLDFNFDHLSVTAGTHKLRTKPWLEQHLNHAFRMIHESLNDLVDLHATIFFGGVAACVEHDC